MRDGVPLRLEVHPDRKEDKLLIVADGEAPIASLWDHFPADVALRGEKDNRVVNLPSFRDPHAVAGLLLQHLGPKIGLQDSTL